MRVVIATVGSGGDLFPLVPIANELTSRDHEVKWLVPRSLGLYARALGHDVCSLGDGSEMRVLHDQRLLTTSFDGWRSWRMTMDDYVLPTLAGDVPVAQTIIRRWRPDVVVTSGFACAARTAATIENVPFVELSIYPQHQMLGPGSRMAPRVSSVISSLAGSDDQSLVLRLCWGTPADVLLHDPLLVHQSVPSVGFSSWDEVPGSSARHGELLGWAASGVGPRVLCTLGSFVGMSTPRWERIMVGLSSPRWRAVVVGPHPSLPRTSGSDVLSVRSFVALSALLSHFDVVVHHGGLGTTIAALRAGLPAAVLPHAFDQSHNARLLERAGVGRCCSETTLRSTIEDLLDDPAARGRARHLGDRHIPSSLAASAAADSIERVGCRR